LDAELVRLAERGHAQAEQARADHIAANQLRCEAEEAATDRGGPKRRKGKKARKQSRRKSKRATPLAKKNARRSSGGLSGFPLAALAKARRHMASRDRQAAGRGAHVGFGC
jgi:hypothetical protein